jgi:hypothetical protein
MSVSKYRFPFNPDVSNIDLTIPIEQNWDLSGMEQGYETYENQILESLLNKEDFETTRISHKPYDLPGRLGLTSINYQFSFWSANTNSYVCSYLPKFEPKQIYYFSNQFSNSFWKLDLYDTPQTQTQKNYITIILPVRQGYFETAQIGVKTLPIRKPYYSLDFIGDTEGFFIYWLKKRNFLNIDTFYMSAKFFDGGTGQFIRMINTPQNTSAPTTFNPELFFYYKVKLLSKTPETEPKLYVVENYPSGIRVGEETNPINWFEYVEP